MATRFYFDQSGGPIDNISPAFSGGWTQTSNGLRRRLVHNKGPSTMGGGTQHLKSSTAASTKLDRQLISDPMTSGIAFTTASQVKGYVMIREIAATDNIDQVAACVKVVSRDGATIRSTMLGVAARGPVAEFLNTGFRSKSICSTSSNGDNLTTGYTTVNGDRLVVELGASNSGTGTTPEFVTVFGDQSTDLAENETQTTASGLLSGWVEFTDTITFESERELFDVIRVVNLRSY